MSNRLLIVFLVAFFALLIFNARNADAAETQPVLKAEVTVDDESVRLGDLLEHAGQAASIPVFYAPELGASGTIQTFRIIEAARQHGIPYFDTRGMSEVTIFRRARTITIAELERAVAEAAHRHLGSAAAGDIAVRFDRDIGSVQIEADARATPRLVHFSYDSYTRRFDGQLDVPGSLTLRKQPLRLSGTVTEMAEVAVLVRNVARGETLRDTDVLMERMPRAEIPSDAATSVGAVVGQAARRVLRAGAAIRPADLMKPDLVARNDTVTILFHAPGLTLTARGKALQAGGEGEMVEVLNPHSKRVLHATVTGPGTVTVSRGNTMTTADASGALR